MEKLLDYLLAVALAVVLFALFMWEFGLIG
jgi:hypothetical protein